MALHRQDQPPRRPDAGKVLGLVRVDAPEGGSTAYYHAHPAARRRKVRHQAAINRRPEELRRRVALNRERRRRGIYGKGGPDISHTSSGSTVLEDPSTNRARNGEGGRPRLRTDAPDAKRGKPCGKSFIPS